VGYNQWIPAPAGVAVVHKQMPAKQLPVQQQSREPRHPRVRSPTLPEQQQDQPLGPGVGVAIAGRRFHITRPLGEGSFGVVWAARDEQGTTVAIKEIPCCKSKLAQVDAEGHLLQRVEQELASAGLSEVTDHIPVLVASEAEQTSPKTWRLRLAMSLVKGVPLEGFLGMQQGKVQVPGMLHVAGNLSQRFARACRYTGALLMQLAPILETFSARVYHRDITPRNILIQEQDDGRGEPSFGLVDFGLAVDASKWRAEEPGAGDLAGDGRYWPASAWFVFCYGRRALEHESWMRSEYRACLDVHSLGITALRCLMELLPHPSELVDEVPELVQTLQGLRAAWKRYWCDAVGLWQPVFEAFRGHGNFEELRASYIKAGAYRVISDDLCVLRAALRDARQACRGFPPETGLAGMPALFDALLLMVQAGRPDSQTPRERAESRSGNHEPRTPSGCGTPRCRLPSVSTASPGSSPSSAASGESDWGDH
jgi:serine/threonine protein kinase